MSRIYRIVLLTITSVILVTIGLLIEGNINSLLQSFWFASGFLLLILLSLVDQPFFSKDSNIFVNAITAGVSLLLVSPENRNEMFYFFSFIVLYLTTSSYSLMILRKNDLKEENVFVQFVSRINRIIGKPDVIFSAFFLWGAVTQYTSSSTKLNSLLLFWVVFSLMNVPDLAKAIEKLCAMERKAKLESVGVIFGVQSRNTFLIKIHESCKSLEMFRFVEFKYSVDDRIRRGLICDIMLLDQERWIKVITNKEIDALFEQRIEPNNLSSDLVYMVHNVPECTFVEKFVGMITESSTIGKVRFLHNSNVKVSEGDMLEIYVNGEKVLYQIVEGRTHIETLSNRNQSGYIVGEAIQLGTWNSTKLQFDKFGWVPDINSPIYLASSIERQEIQEGEIVLGHLPGTNYPVVINTEVAITHHMAVIGVTGSGKSVFSRNLIREYLKDDTVKIICIDFTGEYGSNFNDLAPCSVIRELEARAILEDINWIDIEEGKFSNQRNHVELERRKENANDLITRSITEFMNSATNISIFELPEVENTSGVMTYTQYFFRALFKIAKVNGFIGKRVCLVLEEAHTIIPEWNSAGISDKSSQPLINSIAQIALQGRKYNIGLLVIAQRTANVSKTILTQCNSIISFQEYDKTSIDFLANYFGQDIACTLTKLKFRQAIAAGKAFKSSIPMIFEVPIIQEIEDAQETCLAAV